jgi:hypothetical protein
MTRLYARGMGGKRIREATPGGHWKIMTILGAMSLGGMVATMTIEEPTDTDIFLAYVEHLLYPVLKPGDVVVMDNLSAHKAPAVREGTNQRNPRSGHHRGSAMHNTRQCKGLVQTRPERSTVKRKML